MICSDSNVITHCNIKKDFPCKIITHCDCTMAIKVFMYFRSKYSLNCTVLYYVRDNSIWWTNVHCKSNLTINKLSYSLFLFLSIYILMLVNTCYSDLNHQNVNRW